MKLEWKALYSLKDDPSIIIKAADKGSVVVVWDREDYFKEVDSLMLKKWVNKSQMTWVSLPML